MSIKLFPVQSKPYSGFFRMSTNTFPYSLVLDNSVIVLKMFGFISTVKINTNDIVSFSVVGDEWVVTQKVFNGVVIKYKKGNIIKERVFSFFGFFRKTGNQNSLEFIKYLREYAGTKEEGGKI